MKESCDGSIKHEMFGSHWIKDHQVLISDGMDYPKEGVEYLLNKQEGHVHMQSSASTNDKDHFNLGAECSRSCEGGLYEGQ